MPRSILLVVLLTSALHAPSFAQQEHQTQMPFQGYLEDDLGNPFTGTVPMVFKLYQGNGGSVWTETHPSVSVNNGVFNVALGSITSLIDVSFLHGSSGYSLGVAVDGDPEINPRTVLTAAPYAMSLRGAVRVQPIDDSGLGVYDSDNIIGGHGFVHDGVVGATIGGGGNSDDIRTKNQVYGDYGTVAGGRGNAVGGSDGDLSGRTHATVAGGDRNDAIGAYSSITGGQLGDATGSHSAISGGYLNTASGDSSFVGGGHKNTASGGQSAVLGGSRNTASGNWSAVGGGVENRAAGEASFAAGTYANALHDGTFVWNDKLNSDSLISTAANQFLIGADGGVGIRTATPDGLLDVDNVFKVQTYGTGAENQNARLFFSESNNNKLNGYSIIYAGATGPQTFDGQAFNLPANELHFVRHNSSGAGNVVMSMERATGDVTFASDVDVAGDLNVTGTKNFRIDHPLDPENKYLVHYAMESDEVLNVYSGNVTTDKHGAATVELPAWFDALNRDFRYQLTVVKSFSRAMISEEVHDNRFSIRTEEPGVKVSWQITARRDDDGARRAQPVEQWK